MRTVKQDRCHGLEALGLTSTRISEVVTDLQMDDFARMLI